MTRIRCYQSEPEWTWERWQWRSTLHSRKLQHCWSLTIRLFCIISRTLVLGVLLLCRESVGVFYIPSRLGYMSPGCKCVELMRIEPDTQYLGNRKQNLTVLDTLLKSGRFGLVWFGLVLWHIKHGRLFNAKSSLYIYIKYIRSVNILLITISNKPKLLFLSTVKWFQVFLSNTNNFISY